MACDWFVVEGNYWSVEQMFVCGDLKDMSVDKREYSINVCSHPTLSACANKCFSIFYFADQSKI